MDQHTVFLERLEPSFVFIIRFERNRLAYFAALEKA